MKPMYENLYAAASEMGQGTPGGEQAEPPGDPRLDAAIIGERVRQARFAARLTQQELAGDRYSKSYISAVERGKMTPSLQALGWLAERLGQPMSFFLGENTGDLSGLASAGGPNDRERQQREEEARQMLQEAERLIRGEEPAKALETLHVEANEPPKDLPRFDQPRWYWLVGWALIRQGKFQDALGWSEQGLKLAETLLAQAAPAQQAPLHEVAERLRNFVGGCYYHLDQPEVALEHHYRCLMAITDGYVTHPEVRLLIYRSLGNDHLMVGHHDRAIGFYQRAVKEAENMNEPHQVGLALWGLGFVYKASGDLYRAKTSLEKALDIMGRLGDLYAVSQLRSMVGLALIELKEYGEAEKHLRRGLETAERINNVHARAVALGCLAKLHLAKGDLEQALTRAQEGISVARQGGDRQSQGQIEQTLAEVYEAKHDAAAAEQAYQAALATFSPTQDGEFIGRAHEGYGKLLAAQGRPKEAYEQMRLAREILARRVPAQS